MRHRIRLTESDLHRIVKESVRKVLREGLFDPDDDNEIYDVGDGGKYKVVWEFKTQGTVPYEYNTVSEGEKVVASIEEAYDIVDMLSKKYKGAYATKFRIERLIKTLSDDRWEHVYDLSNWYVGK